MFFITMQGARFVTKQKTIFLRVVEICVDDANRYRRNHVNTPDLVHDSSLAISARRYAESLFPRVFHAYLRDGWKKPLPVVHDPHNRRYRWGENIFVMSSDRRRRDKAGDLTFYCRKANFHW